MNPSSETGTQAPLAHSSGVSNEPRLFPVKTPPSWPPGVRIADASGVSASVENPAVWHVERGGRVTLTVSEPVSGWCVVNAAILRVDGGLGLFLGDIVAEGEDRPSPFVPVGGIPRALCHVPKEGARLTFRPRRYPGAVKVRAIWVVPVPWWQAPLRTLQQLWAGRRGWRPGWPYFWRERLARLVSFSAPETGALFSRSSRWHRAAVRRAETQQVSAWLKRPALWSEALPVAVADGPARLRERSIRSIEAAPGADVAAPEDAALVLAAGDLLAPYAPHALRRVPRGPVVGDEDRVSGRMRHSPTRRAGWDPITERFGAAMPCFGAADEEGADRGRVAHVPLVLVHRHGPAERPPMRPIVRTASAPITIIVATRDAPHLLRRFLKTLATTKGAYRLILVDHMTRDAAALRLLGEARGAGHQVITQDGPFNYAALNNKAARLVDDGVLIFANNDIAFTDPGWMEPLAAIAEDPGVGCAGALLRYPGGGLQHAGLVFAGEAGPRHLDRFLPHNHPGHDNRLTRVHAVDAVSAALMAITAERFHSLGGFDEAFAVRYNDIDLNLRAEATGVRNVLVPQSHAVHHESASLGLFRSRGPAPAREAERVLFHTRWSERLQRRPYYSPHLEPASARYWPRPHPPSLPAEAAPAPD